MQKILALRHTVLVHDSCVIISAGNDQSNILKNDSVLVPIDSVSPAPIHDSDVSEQHDKKKEERNESQTVEVANANTYS